MAEDHTTTGMTMNTNKKLAKLRRVITENLRVQRGGADPVPYIDVANVLNDICARQNHAIFARRGCGKTLLLHHSSTLLDSSIKAVYLNCEDFKKHSFPNVLIEILDKLFSELEQYFSGWFAFGGKRRARKAIASIRNELSKLRTKADKQEQSIRESVAAEASNSVGVTAAMSADRAGIKAHAGQAKRIKTETERSYQILKDKVRELDDWLPRLKREIEKFFASSKSIKAIFIQIDDFYHLRRVDQPLVADYIHRLCKDLPLYFKIATLRHATTLYADREGQPIGAQERNDYQPINIDFTFSNFPKTKEQNLQILRELGKLAGLERSDIDGLFKGEGFERLVIAGGGVPRDFLSLFLEVMGAVQNGPEDGRIGKDDVRILSRSNFERRIEELKQDSNSGEQDSLIRAIYVIRRFCIDKQTNVFLVSEQMMQQRDDIRDLIYRLLDYRIIHSAGSALTHKSQPGSYQSFAIDIGCYAHLRKLHGRFNELYLADPEIKENMRSAPILDETAFDGIWQTMPSGAEAALKAEDVAEAA